MIVKCVCNIILYEYIELLCVMVKFKILDRVINRSKYTFERFFFCYRCYILIEDSGQWARRCRYDDS